MSKTKQTEKDSENVLKETFESIVIAFILAFVFRAYVVEAFVIPTGSMAPTLYGRHMHVTCEQCGYRFATDTPRGERTPTRIDSEAAAVCPMCHFQNLLRVGTRVSAGDRILVHKYIYSLTEPRRWDVVVFKAPHDPNTNFIKRLVGLPHERLCIIDGNIYTQPTGDSSDQPWRIARKTERPRVQKTVWQPIYHSRYVPLDGGRRSIGRAQHPWQVPWLASQPAAWNLSGRHSYRYTQQSQGFIRFDFQRAQHGGPGIYWYNQLKQLALPFEPIEDIRVVATFVPDGPGLAVSLHTTSRADDPHGRMMEVVGQIDETGKASLSISPTRDAPGETWSESVQLSPFAPGIGRRVELWYVDQEASLWVDGQQVLRRQFELPLDTLMSRRGLVTVPRIKVAVRGTPVTLHRVQVDRDLYYTNMNPNGSPARGALFKADDGYVGQPFELGADEFLCFGDNSPLSHDSRFWGQVNPWIHARMFKQGTDHQAALGIVPRKLLMGKAFFVYFPAPLGFVPENWPVVFVPNFESMRFIY